MSCPATEKNVLVRLQSGEIVCFAIVRKKKRKKEGKTSAFQVPTKFYIFHEVNVPLCVDITFSSKLNIIWIFSEQFHSVEY